MQKSLSSLTLISMVSLTAVLTAQAQNTASDSLNYAPGNAVIATEGTGGTGWGSAWNSKSDTTTVVLSQVLAGSLGYTDGSGNTLSTSGGSLVSSTVNGTAAQPQRALSSTFGTLAAANTTAAGTLWMSYLWQGLNTTGSGSGLYRQATMMFITGATSGAGTGSERLDIGMPNISAANQATILPNVSLWSSGGIAGQTVLAASPLQSTVAANNGYTTFVLVEMIMDNTSTTADTMYVWLNPTLTGATPVGSPNLTYAGQDLSVLNGIRIQSGNLNPTFGSVGGAQQVDEINFGYTPLDVEAVPEPASMALVALSGLALLALKRKQS